jgi:glycosyltransferase involved in cell wall biosynthesis
LFRDLPENLLSTLERRVGHGLNRDGESKRIKTTFAPQVRTAVIVPGSDYKRLKISKLLYHFRTVEHRPKNKHEGIGYHGEISALPYTRLILPKALQMPHPQAPRVLLLIPHLGGGGAEQVIALLAQALPREKYELHLGLITQASAPGISIPPWVTTHALGASRVRSAAFRLLRLVRRLRPRVILSGMFHLNFLVLLLRPLFPRTTRVLVRQNGTISAALAFGGLPVYTRLLYWLLYRRADLVICQTAAMAGDLAHELALQENRLVVLPNPVHVHKIRTAYNQIANHSNGPGPHLLSVGRLSREKGFDLLLEAFAGVRRRFPSAHLVIAGKGPEEAALKALCRELGIELSVRFAGHVDDPATLFSNSTVFVLPSRHEGLPNALLEAAAGGLPIVALPASGGVVDLLRGQPGVWLAPEISSLALATSLFAALHALRPGERFTHPFVEEFSVDRSVHAYEGLIDAMLLNAKIREMKVCAT